MKVFTAILVAFLFLKNSYCQSQYKSIYQTVLDKKNKSRKLVFGKWNEKGQTETHLRYLGKIKTRKGRIIKIVNSSFFWGLSKRATSRIMFFNQHNQYLGNFYLTLVSDLPTRIENNFLVFTNLLESDCDKKLVTFINLENGIPKFFFRKCKGKYGDIFTFN